MKTFSDPKSQSQYQIIKEILIVPNKVVFIKGGWNIDLSYGEQTREHKDLDFHYDLKDKDFWQNFFSERGYDREDVNDFYSVYRKDGVVIDFEGFKLEGEELTWSHGGKSTLEKVMDEGSNDEFKFKRMKLGVEVYLKNKARENGQEIREKDDHDLKRLNELLEK